MTIFIVHSPPQNGTADAFEHARFTEESGSRLALFLPPVFLALHRLWYALAVYGLVAACALAIAVLGYPAAATALLALAALYLWLEGNELVRRKLEAGDWRLAAVLSAPNREVAEWRYFNELAAPQQRGVTLRRPVPGFQGGNAERPSIGIFSE